MIGTKTALGAAVAIVLIAGCGGSSPADLSATGAVVLKRDADALAAAARRGDSDATRSALAALRRDVAQQQADGGLSATRATRVVAAAVRVAADVPVPKVTPSPTPVVQTSPPAVHGGDKGKGKDKSEGGGD